MEIDKVARRDAQMAVLYELLLRVKDEKKDTFTVSEIEELIDKLALSIRK